MREVISFHQEFWKRQVSLFPKIPGGLEFPELLKENFYAKCQILYNAFTSIPLFNLDKYFPTKSFSVMSLTYFSNYTHLWRRLFYYLAISDYENYLITIEEIQKDFDNFKNLFTLFNKNHQTVFCLTSIIHELCNPGPGSSSFKSILESAPSQNTVICNCQAHFNLSFDGYQ